MQRWFPIDRDFCEVLAIACLNRADHVDRGNVDAGKRAVVHDLFDARAGGGDLSGLAVIPFAPQ